MKSLNKKNKYSKIVPLNLEFPCVKLVTFMGCEINPN